MHSVNWQKCVCAVIGSAIVGLTGVVPVLACGSFFQGNDKGHKKRLKLLLSFALGSLMANIFLHILPECWTESKTWWSTSFSFHILSKYRIVSSLLPFCTQGHFIITGIIGFIALEKPAGYLNLIANVFDNFVHGLSVGTGFTISTRVGVVTVLSIVAHEIPHEFSDFALLLHSGFSVEEAVFAQMCTSASSIFGAMLSLFLCKTGNLSILIFLITCGAFIHLCLLNIFPELRNERDLRESIKQIVCMVCGVTFVIVLAKTGIM